MSASSLWGSQQQQSAFEASLEATSSPGVEGLDDSHTHPPVMQSATATGEVAERGNIEEVVCIGGADAPSGTPPDPLSGTVTSFGALAGTGMRGMAKVGI